MLLMLLGAVALVVAVAFAFAVAVAVAVTENAYQLCIIIHRNTIKRSPLQRVRQR